MYKLATILLADDDDDDRLLFQDALRQIYVGINVVIASDGEQMIDMLVKGLVPDVVFLDLNMPRKNGFECLQEIRNSDIIPQDIPVIIFSTTSQLETIDMVFKLGANYYISKPQSFPGLKAVLKEVLSTDLTPGVRTSRQNFVLRSA